MNRIKKDKSGAVRTPLLNDSRCSNIDNCFITAPVDSLTNDDVQLNTQNKIAAPNETADATIWFSVNEEMKVPSAMKAAPIRKRPR